MLSASVSLHSNIVMFGSVFTWLSVAIYTT